MLAYHPRQISICGYSGSGKTTLICRLIDSLSRKQYGIGYFKHDAHRFEMDRPGKDTHRVWEAGARLVAITDPTHRAVIDRSPGHEFSLGTGLTCDFVLVEGYKNSDLPKLVVLDRDQGILQKPLTNVVGLIGQSPPTQDFGLPFFHRDDIHRIAEFVLSLWKPAPLTGLVLIGGQSKRMQTNKSGLVYHNGKSQASHCYDLLAPFCEAVYISCRSEQAQSCDLARLPQIHDRFLGYGPLSGLLSAMQTKPNTAWLAIACDLPYLNPQTIEQLLTNRQPFKSATCFRVPGTDMPEPVCGIYEPSFRHHAFSALFTTGHHQQTTSLRTILLNSNAALIEAREAKALTNVNDYQIYTQILRDLSCKT